VPTDLRPLTSCAACAGDLYRNSLVECYT
jgi:hypothetical protein